MSASQLQDRVVVVTGAGSGIGRAVANAFAEQGTRLFLCDIARDRVDAAARELTTAHPVAAQAVDVADYGQVDAFMRRAASAAGRIDVLVNNAGVFDGYAGISETTPDLWRRVIDINLGGCFNGCKAVFPIMAEQRRGRIINMSSVAALRGAADGLSYTASKAGIVGLTRRLAVDAGSLGITVNAICPGVIQTDIRRNSEEVLAGIAPDMNRGVGVSPEVMRWLIPAGRSGFAEEVASLAIFLASDAAAYITGQAISIDGGWTAT